MIRFLELEALGVSVAAFSEREDGDCGDPSRGRTAPGRERVCLACGVDPKKLVCAEQVHGTAIARVEMADAGRGAIDPASALPRTDGLITETAGLPLAVFAADCVPLYLVDPQRRAVGLVHAGRQGALANVAGHAVDMLQREFRCRPDSLCALIGPSAGPSRYEVSAELAEAWRAADLPLQGRYLDLWEANVRQLVQAGLRRDHIAVSRLCTISNEQFFSHRRSPDGRRNMALLML